MEFRYKHLGKVKEGKLIYEDPSLLQRHLMSLEGEDVEILVRKRRIPASSGQMSFYVGIVLKEAHRHNNFIHYESPKILHDKIIAPLFLSEYSQIGGKPKIRELSDLNKDEMWELTERVVAWLNTEFGIVIADKEKYHFK